MKKNCKISGSTDVILVRLRALEEIPNIAAENNTLYKCSLQMLQMLQMIALRRCAELSKLPFPFSLDTVISSMDFFDALLQFAGATKALSATMHSRNQLAFFLSFRLNHGK